MLIPSIDLMGGKIVQLIRGEKKALEFDNIDYWVSSFSRYPLVQLIDLDAAKEEGSNRQLVGELSARLRCQVGGGIRTSSDVQALLDCGAQRVILGSSLFRPNTDETPGTKDTVNVAFAESVSAQFGADRLVFAVDSLGGRVAIHGWKTVTEIDPAAMMRQLGSYCSAFLYTHIDGEGMMEGLPMDVIRNLQQQTSRRLIAAGGIHRPEEIEQLDKMGVDAVVGMAIYSGLLAM
jgi:phosphoribosylformimino-5-aminoimidazole carboxamide ribotide isomerase